MKFAEIFSPGEMIREELDARGWTQGELGDIMGRPTRLINELIAGKRGITPETAVQLASALGTSPELWMNLESQYQLSKIPASATDLVTKRAALYDRYPVTEMLKRGWVSASEKFEVLEQNFARFFELSNPTAQPVFAHAAKKTGPADTTSIEQLAWLFRARALARTQHVSEFQKSKCREALTTLSTFRHDPSRIQDVPAVLATVGVRFVIVQALKGSKIDGACFWLKSNQPVVAMSLRFDRIDNFWFVLRHELEHVLQGHGKELGFVLDQDMGDASLTEESDEEMIANRAAAQFCADQAALANFVKKNAPYFSEAKILAFASQLGVHPGILIGQLQRAIGRPDLLRKHLVKVAHFLG